MINKIKQTSALKCSLQIIFGLIWLASCTQAPHTGAPASSRETAYRFYMQALSLSDSGKYNESLVQLDKAIAINHYIASFFILQSEIYEKTAQYDAAIASSLRALNLRTNEPRTLEKVARLYGMKHDYPAASSFLKKALIQNPAKLEWLLLIAEYELLQMHYERARDYLQQYKLQAANTVSFSDKYFCLMGRYEYLTGYYDLAEEAFKTCYRQGTADTTDIRLYLYVCFKTGRNEEAFNLLMKAGNHLLKADDAVYFKGLYYYFSGNMKDAKKQFGQVLQRNYPDANLYYYLGKVYLGEQDHGNAREMFSRFRERSDDIELIKSLDEDAVPQKH
jgi:tetratricopeptide (TPR) repeat protein